MFAAECGSVRFWTQLLGASRERRPKEADRCWAASEQQDSHPPLTHRAKWSQTPHIRPGPQKIAMSPLGFGNHARGSCAATSLDALNAPRGPPQSTLADLVKEWSVAAIPLDNSFDNSCRKRARTAPHECRPLGAPVATRPLLFAGLIIGRSLVRACQRIPAHSGTAAT